MTLGIIAVILVSLAVHQANVILSLIWVYFSIYQETPHDETRSADTPRKIFTGLTTGCVAGFFLALPAFILFKTAPSSSGVSLETCRKIKTQGIVDLGRENN